MFGIPLAAMGFAWLPLFRAIELKEFLDNGTRATASIAEVIPRSDGREGHIVLEVMPPAGDVFRIRKAVSSSSIYRVNQKLNVIYLAEDHQRLLLGTVSPDSISRLEIAGALIGFLGALAVAPCLSLLARQAGRQAWILRNWIAVEAVPDSFERTSESLSVTLSFDIDGTRHSVVRGAYESAVHEFSDRALLLVNPDNHEELCLKRSLSLVELDQ
jgi:hypothetical protein